MCAKELSKSILITAAREREGVSGNAMFCRGE